MHPFPDFTSVSVLTDHISDTLNFYYPRSVDTSGGFYHYFKDNGSIYDRQSRHLVSSTRFVFVYSMAYRHFDNPAYLEQVKHGVDFLRQVHRDPLTGGYAWQLRWEHAEKTVIDGDNHCYGLAFVMLAYAHALMAGVAEASDYLDETMELMERRFWEPQHGLYADQASADWQHLDNYRGQNANMHACEALLAAYEATGALHFLHRAETLAHNITQRQAALAGGMIWEHYDASWNIDWNYNLEDKANLFRPWGFQPGHFTEWSKLLLQLESHAQHLQHDTGWLLPAAEALFQKALQFAWDEQYGGICYGFAPDGSICDGDKYFWVQAESMAAAALLAKRTGKQTYWDNYEHLWQYSWQHMIDHEYGAWFRILSRENHKLSDEKSPAGKVDYHTMGACYEILRVLKEMQHGS